MRRLFLILLIALLPLRGWAGAVMSIEMALQERIAAHHVGQGVHHAATAQKPDCHEHGAAAGHVAPLGDTAAHNVDHDVTPDTTPSNHCNTCVACQICHSVALTGLSPVAFAPPVFGTPAASGSIRFASATLAAYLKPPIS
jgi:hypothetical protein